MGALQQCSCKSQKIPSSFTLLNSFVNLSSLPHPLSHQCFASHRTLSGDLADVRIWDRVLSPDEVQAAKKATVIDAASPLGKGLVSAYRFAPDTIDDGGRWLRDR